MTKAPAKASPRVGAYEILQKVGSGGMSTVYKARDTRTNAIVAIKVASKAVAEDVLSSKRFALETKVSKTLSHPHLVKVLDHGEQDGIPFLVMEYMEGQTLAQWLKSELALDENAVRPIALQMADALTYLHSQQIIHRDVKPANILFDAYGQARLADLGLSKDLDSQSKMTRSRIGLGTIQFAAPEQFIDARGVDPRSDVYGLAATLYVAVTGHVPFGTRSPVQVLQRKLHNQFDAPIVWNPQLSPAMDAAIRLGLHANRERRPETCLEFAGLLTGETPPPRLGKLPGAMPPPTSIPKPINPSGRERRTSVRYEADLESACRPVNAPKQQRWPALIKDISRLGVCLSVKRRFEIGVLLDLQFAMEKDGGTTSQVVRVRRLQACDENVWEMGCEFIAPLDQDDLEAFLSDRLHVTVAF